MDTTRKSTLDESQLCHQGRLVVDIELQAIQILRERIDSRFELACQHLLCCKGRVVVMGMGKSGHIGSKIAATFASTGTPAFFVHPGEAGHGDMGMITKGDVVLALSNSGETTELLTLVPLIKRLQIPLITMTGKPNSTLAVAADVNLDVSVEKEACPLGLAPTSSTTATLVMGDALAIALLNARGFTEQDFAFSHPGGALGRKLLLTVADLMLTGDRIPRVNQNTSLKTALMEMTEKRLGMTAVVDDHNHILGIFTDGDLRRTLEHGHDIHHTKMREIMTVNCKSIKPDTLAIDALQTMKHHHITTLIVTDENQELLGIVHMHDLLRAGIAL